MTKEGNPMHRQLLVTFGALLAAPALAAEPTAVPAAPPAEPPAATAPAAAPEKPAHTGRVTRSVFTSTIQEREPVDTLTSLGTDQNRIYFFTEIRDMSGETVTHRWEYNGKIMAEVPFQIGGPRWRVYSSKTLDPSWTGEWKVSVVDSQGSTLSVSTFHYTPAPAPAAARPSAEPAPAAAPAAPASPGTRN